MQHGPCGWAGCGGFAGERIGDGNGDAANFLEQTLVADTIVVKYNKQIRLKEKEKKLMKDDELEQQPIQAHSQN